MIRLALLHVLIGLEGGTGGIARGGGVGGSHGDLTGGATGLPVVVGTVLHVTAYALDVITALLVVHFHLPSFVNPRYDRSLILSGSSISYAVIF